MFADGLNLLLVPYFRKKKFVNIKGDDVSPAEHLKGIKLTVVKWIINKQRMKKVFALVLGGVLPLILFYLVRDPVEILAIAGTVAAVHIPVVAFLTLYINRTKLPIALRPGAFTTAVMVIAGMAYTTVAVFHFISL